MEGTNLEIVNQRCFQLANKDLIEGKNHLWIYFRARAFAFEIGLE